MFYLYFVLTNFKMNKNGKKWVSNALNTKMQLEVGFGTEQVSLD
jgi:hypothetical protein